MKQSTERILTTHVGSLPRPPDLLDMIRTKERGDAFDGAAFAARVKGAVAEVVKRQADAGIDVVADGEMGRFGFIPYVNERLAGVEPRPNPGGEGTWARSREHLAFPEYYAWAAQMPGAAGGAPPTRWVCTGPIAYKGHQALARDIDNLKAALAQVRCEEAFMPAVSPAQLAGWNRNEYYKTDEEFRARAGRCAARGIPGDRRCRPRPADRRPAAGEPLHDAPRTRHCAVPRLGERHRRAVESRARRHPRRAGALSHLLWHQHGSAGARPRAEAHRRHHAPGQRRRLFLRGRQPAPRA